MTADKQVTEPDALDALAQIEANLNREEIEWEPTEVGDQIIGYVGGIEYVEAKNGSRIGVLLIDTKDGARVRVWAGRTRLRKQLVRNKVQPGDALGIRYLGQQSAKNGGNDYFDYKVDVVRVGPRRDGEMFTDTDDDLGLVPGATDIADPWATGSSTEEVAPF